MYGKVFSANVLGVDGQLIEVEVDVSRGLPQFHIVGLPDSSVREAAERVRAAIKNCQCKFPQERVTVNLAPADIRKEGAALDLAIALGILQASGQLYIPDIDKYLIAGELALDGSLRPIRGVMSMAEAALSIGIKKTILPVQNAEEALLVKGIHVLPLTHLKDIFAENRNLINDINDLSHLLKLTEKDIAQNDTVDDTFAEDFADVLGQQHAKRALMIAAAGMHNILLIGPPGSGKTMLARRLISILPELSDEESLQVTKIQSISGKLSGRFELIRERPFRSPHHTISTAGMIGGGSIPKPGEVSLAHRGVLFLDEVLEFPRSVLEALRQPLEDRMITIGRAKAVCTFPAHFLLVLSMNPCQCGFYGSEGEAVSCTCSPNQISRYQSRLSGPLLDRIDLHVEMPRVQLDKIKDRGSTSSSRQMMQSIQVALTMQKERYKNNEIRFNAELSGKLLLEHCMLPKNANKLLRQSFEALGLSMRAHDRILKIARTIADFNESELIEETHIAEAIQYRNLDRRIMHSKV